VSPLLGIEANTSTGSLVPAVVASVALHVAVLAGVPDPASYAADAPRAPLNARLAPADAPRAAELPPAVLAPQERDSERRASPPRRAERRAPPPHAAPRAEPPRSVARAELPAVPVTPVAPAAREERAVASVPETPAAPSSAAAGRPEPVAALGEPALVPRATPEAVDPGSLGQYRLALIGTARRHKLYPETARERGWEGRVAVELVVDADGALAAATVRQSSGHAVLDREALEMLRRAAALTPVPPALKGREFRLEVPVQFELRSG
jgi:protein TonB